MVEVMTEETHFLNISEEASNLSHPMSQELLAQSFPSCQDQLGLTTEEGKDPPQHKVSSFQLPQLVQNNTDGIESH